MQTQSVIGKAIYFCTFIDDYSRYTWVYYLKSKDQQSEVFQNFKVLVEKQFNKSIKILCTDRGGEYESKEFAKFLRDSGIVHEQTIPDTPQQNGLTEQFNRTIVGSAKSMLHTAGLTFGFWVEAVRTAIHVHNRSPSQVIDWKTPHELTMSRVPDIDYL